MGSRINRSGPNYIDMLICHPVESLTKSQAKQERLATLLSGGFQDALVTLPPEKVSTGSSLH